MLEKVKIPTPNKGTGRPQGSTKEKKLEESLRSLLPSHLQLEKELCTRSFTEFVKSAWNVLEPSTPYLHNWHIELISEYLQMVSEGKIKRLIINIPPRYMKSLLVSVMWPAWMWIQKPHYRWISASYSASLSLKHNLDKRNLIQSDWYQSHWGGIVKLSEDQNQKSEFQNTARGYMVATSVGGTVTGKGGNIIILDDPLNPQEAISDSLRGTCNNWIDQTLSTRLDDKKNGCIVVVMQRLHELDPTGHLLQKTGAEGVRDWKLLVVPAEAHTNLNVKFPKTGRKLIRKTGDILWPEREGKKELSLQKRALGSYGYAGQYQQAPSPLGGGMIKESWWKYYDLHQLDLTRMDQWIQSWDMNFKETKAGSWIVGQVWARKNANYYLIDQMRLRADFPEAVRAVLKLCRKWPQCGPKLIEDKANGPAIISTLSDRISGIIGCNPGNSSKEARVSAIAYLIEAGNVWLPNPLDGSWVDEFVSECSKFPNGTFDDQVDSMSQALSFFPKSTQYGLGLDEEAEFGGPRRLAKQEMEDVFEVYSGFSGRSSFNDMNPW